MPGDYPQMAASSSKGKLRGSIGALADAFRELKAPGPTAQSRKNAALGAQGRYSEADQGPGGDDTGARTAAAWNQSHPLPAMDAHGRQIGALADQKRKF